MSPNNSQWWRGTSVYQIYPRSYLDSNTDGIGDIRGIISKLDYIRDAGFETIWLSPFVRSPQQDFGYDISNYDEPAPEYGTAADVEQLIGEVHRRGMYIILDMVLNHTSSRHPWFIESSSSRNNPKRDWYIWRNGRRGPFGKRPPNNWKSQTGGSGWQYDARTDQWYWAAFLPFQPDLNYRNPEVREAVFSMLGRWIDRGADGFRLDIIGSIFEDSQFRDSPFIPKLLPDEENDGMLFRSTCRTQNLPESMDFCRGLRSFIDEKTSGRGFLVGETFGSPETISGFCRDGGLQAAFAFKCTGVPFTAGAFRELIEEYETCFAEPLTPAWAFSNHDRTRRITALGGNPAAARLNAAFQITVRGIPFFYFGEEIGMTDTRLSHRDSLDPVSFPFKKLPAPVFRLLNKKLSGSLNRDCVRTPMQWNDSVNAGFCGERCSPWLPVNPDYTAVNTEQSESDPDSLLHCFRRFLSLRKESDALKFGSLKLIDTAVLPPTVLGYERENRKADGNTERLSIYLNFSSSPAAFAGGCPGPVIVSTHHGTEAEKTGRLSAFEGIVVGSRGR